MLFDENIPPEVCIQTRCCDLLRQAGLVFLRADDLSTPNRPQASTTRGDPPLRNYSIPSQQRPLSARASSPAPPTRRNLRRQPNSPKPPPRPRTPRITPPGCRPASHRMASKPPPRPSSTQQPSTPRRRPLPTAPPYRTTPPQDQQRDRQHLRSRLRSDDHDQRPGSSSTHTRSDHDSRRQHPHRNAVARSATLQQHAAADAPAPAAKSPGSSKLTQFPVPGCISGYLHWRTATQRCLNPNRQPTTQRQPHLRYPERIPLGLQETPPCARALSCILATLLL